MGTNYYALADRCNNCGRVDEIHLGKASGGWKFSFQYNSGKFYKNVEEMKAWLLGKEVRDEYNRKVTHEDFWRMVEEKQKDNRSHAGEFGDDSNEMVIDGYSFSDREFS